MKRLIAFIIFIVAVILPVGLTVYWSVSRANHAIRQTIFEDIEVTAKFRQSEVLLQLEELKVIAKNFASDGFITEKLAETDISAGQALGVDNSLNTHLVVNKLSLFSAIKKIHIVNVDGIVVGSTVNKDLGTDVSSEEFYSEGLKRTFLSKAFNQGDEYFILVATPIYDREQPSETIGVLINYYDFTVMSSILSGTKAITLGASETVRSIGQTGEIYLVNEDKLMITDSLFLGNTKFKQIVDTVPVRACQESNQTMKGEWDDYRGVRVIGASTCISLDSEDWVLLSEQDAAEAYAIENAIWRLAFISGNILIGILLIAYFFTRIQFIVPLQRLTKVSMDIVRGKKNIKIDRKLVANRFSPGDLARSLKDINSQQLEKKNQRYEFIKSASHQFRTPLSVIRMQTEMLRESKHEDIAVEKEQVNSISDNTITLVDIVDDLLTILEYDESYIPKDVKLTELNQIVSSTVDSLSDLSKSSDIALEVDLPKESIQMRVVEKDIRTMLVQLLKNAIIYSNPKTAVKISLLKQNNNIVLEVSDSGIGIPKEDQIFIYDRFFRAKNAYAKKNSSSGLGLTIVRNIVNTYGGKVSVQSKVKKGSTFTVVFPLASSEG